MKKRQKDEIMWNLINSFLAGAISFFSALVATISADGFDSHNILIACMIAFITSSLIGLYKFKEYWDGERTEFQACLFCFMK